MVLLCVRVHTPCTHRAHIVHTSDIRAGHPQRPGSISGEGGNIGWCIDIGACADNGACGGPDMVVMANAFNSIHHAAMSAAASAVGTGGYNTISTRL